MKSKTYTNPFLILLNYRSLLSKTVATDIKSRFAGSFLGLLWLFLYPICFLSVYASVYIYIFKARVQGFTSAEYVFLIFSGLIPFLGFSESLGIGVTSITSNASLIKNTLFPIDLIPVKAVLVAQVNMLAALSLLLFGLTITGKLSIWLLLLLIIIPLQVMFCIGLVWIIASLNVYFRDLQQIITIVVMLSMLMSPIAYTIDMTSGIIHLLIQLNPLYYMISCYQAVLIFQRPPAPETFCTFAVMSSGVFLLGYHFLNRMKLLFADNV